MPWKSVGGTPWIFSSSLCFFLIYFSIYYVYGSVYGTSILLWASSRRAGAFRGEETKQTFLVKRKTFERWFLFLYLTNQKEMTLTAPRKKVQVELLGGNETTAGPLGPRPERPRGP